MNNMEINVGGLYAAAIWGFVVLHLAFMGQPDLWDGVTHFFYTVGQCQ